MTVHVRSTHSIYDGAFLFGNQGCVMRSVWELGNIVCDTNLYTVETAAWNNDLEVDLIYVDVRYRRCSDVILCHSSFLDHHHVYIIIPINLLSLFKAQIKKLMIIWSLEYEVLNFRSWNQCLTRATLWTFSLRVIIMTSQCNHQLWCFSLLQDET